MPTMMEALAINMRLDGIADPVLREQAYKVNSCLDDMHMYFVGRGLVGLSVSMMASIISLTLWGNNANSPAAICVTATLFILSWICVDYLALRPLNLRLLKKKEGVLMKMLSDDRQLTRRALVEVHSANPYTRWRAKQYLNK